MAVAAAGTLAAALACAPAPKGARAADGPDPAASTSVSTPVEPPPTPAAVPGSEGPDTRCDLAQGTDSRVERPFVAVIRDDATYRALAEKIFTKIPPLEERFLPSGVVVAALLGPKPTPGYKVTIRRDGSTFRVGEQRPEAGAMLAQVITTPFAVAAYPEAPDAPVIVDPGETIGRSLMDLAVRSGQLTVSGGIAGVSETWTLTGTVRASIFEPLATFLFDLSAASEQGTKEWKGTLTVVESRAAAFEGLLWDASPLVPPPCKSLAVQGTLDTARGKLSLRFSPGPCKSSDAFSAKGEIEATFAPKPASN
jgi:hypothetical protein